jgi:hypothetical protein
VLCVYVWCVVCGVLCVMCACTCVKLNHTNVCNNGKKYHLKSLKNSIYIFGLLYIEQIFDVSLHFVVISCLSSVLFLLISLSNPLFYV